MKQLNLNSVGLGLDSVPFRFGWELLEWQPKIIESRVESGENLCDEFMETHEEIKVEDEQAEVFGPQIELDLGIGSDPVRDFGEEMIHEIADQPGDTFEKVGDIDLIKEEQTPTEPVSSTPSTENLTREEPRKKRVKTTAGRFDLPLLQKFFGLTSKSSPSPPKQPSA